MLHRDYQFGELNLSRYHRGTTTELGMSWQSVRRRIIALVMSSCLYVNIHHSFLMPVRFVVSFSLVEACLKLVSSALS